MIEIGDSPIKDVCQHQIALLNLGASDVNHALKANFPFYVEQRALRAVGGHLKAAASADGTATQGGQGAADRDIKVGSALSDARRQAGINCIHPNWRASEATDVVNPSPYSTSGLG